CRTTFALTLHATAAIVNKCFHNSLNTSSTYSSHCGSVRLLPCFCRLTDPPSTSKLLLRATRLIPSHPVLQCPSRRSLLTSHNLHRHRTLICHGNTSLSQLTRIIQQSFTSPATAGHHVLMLQTT
ncbi:hypothetical protein TGPRC2_306688, partial [Toxoplasma gondii TgCatPRC2]